MIERTIIEKIDTDEDTIGTAVYWAFINPLKMCFEALCEQIPEGTDNGRND